MVVLVVLKIWVMGRTRPSGWVGLTNKILWLAMAGQI